MNGTLHNTRQPGYTGSLTPGLGAIFFLEKIEGAMAETDGPHQVVIASA
jgi:hypothetical protein